MKFMPALQNHVNWRASPLLEFIKWKSKAQKFAEKMNNAN